MRVMQVPGTAKVIFDVTIESAKFSGKNRVQRHQMIYDALRDLLQTDIHALRIKAFTPSER